MHPARLALVLPLLTASFSAMAHDEGPPPKAKGPGLPWIFFPKFDPLRPLSTNPVDLAGSVSSQTTDWVFAPVAEATPGRIALTFTAGASGVATGGGLKVMLGHVLPTVEQIYTPFSLTVTSAYFFKVNLLKDATATCSDPDVRLHVEAPRPGRSFGQLLRYVKYKRDAEGASVRDGLLRQIDNEFAVRITVTRGALKPGDTVTVTLGATKGLAPPPSEASWQIVTRLDGDGTYGLLADAPDFDAYSHDTHRVVAIAPSTLYPGETSRMTLSTRDDDFLPNLTRFSQGVVTLDPVAGLSFPTAVTFTGGLESWEGSLTHVAITAETPGLYRVHGQATIDGKTFPVLSNPIEVVPVGEQKVYFGDLHLHSILSYDADRPPEYVYWRQRYEERHDFAALSDHDMIGAVPFAARSTVSGRTPDEWAYAKALGDRLNQPGEFATILAYEWTSYYFGHRNIFFAAEETDPPLFHHNYPSDHPPFDERSPGELRDALAADAHRYIAIPHSTAWPTKNVRYEWGPGSGKDKHFLGDPSIWPEERELELYSTHGTSEYFDNEYAVDKGHPETPLKSGLLRKLLNYDIKQAPADSGNFGQDALAAGWRFGFVGSSDDHYLSHLDQAYKSGMAAVLAPALTRKDIWDGLYAHHSYAVTGVRILLHLTANGAPMGSVLSGAGPVSFAARINGVGPLDRVELVKYDGHIWTSVYSFDAAGMLDHHFAAVDNAKPGDLYYLRVRQVNGNRAWSSPVWVE